ncbi:T9SS type A sorting domain-containing protein [Terrimonas pollutisoli]|uniref:T9SS type A sorting domain-containing protein n=1 Tax=Terrimonas pollutisoli TaxID=3034147 RepID=UPI0023EB90DB|nr:T9SS type A sorting domain-containing protein [Terrimonas sp. H1YJ31]
MKLTARGWRIALTVLVFAFLQKAVKAQSPGLIVRPAAGNGAGFLNPNGDSHTSASASGFSSNDIAESEIPYKVVPPIITEPTGDLATGPSGGFSDIVKTVDNSGFYIYFNGTNILFRLRIGNIISGSKGYSILFDTDGKIGNSGPGADPNFIASTNTSNGNPGFEYEVVLQTNFDVSVYNVDGTSSPVLVNTYSLATNSQISVALSTDSGNPDYFYDFGIPVTAIGSPASFRMVATTVTSPSSALQGSRSDIYGINDSASPNTAVAWETVITAQPAIAMTDLGTLGPGVAAVCTAAPVINTPISNGAAVSVTGTWTRLDASKPSSAMVTLYKNGTIAGTTTVATGDTWSILVPVIASGDVFYAKAQASGESMCLQSSSVTAGCTSIPAAPVLSCASSKGISGTMGLGNTIQIYLLPTTNASPTSNPLVTNISYPTPTTFAYYVNGCSGGTNNVANGTYMLVTSNGSCTSAPTFECISSGSSSLVGLVTNAITLTTPVYPYHTTINGSGVASGNILRLFINGKYSSTVTATGTTFSFTDLSLKSGDQLKIYLSAAGSTCMTGSNTFTVSCYTTPPVISTTNGGNLIATSTSVSGTSSYSGATVTLYSGTAPGGVAVGSPATTSSNGSWTISGITITAGQNYYATQSYAGCASLASASALALAPTTICPTITGSYNDASTTISGTLSSAFSGTVRLYLDGSLIGSVNVTTASAWSIPVNSSASNKLYTGGVLTASAQSSTGAENTNCPGSIVVSCAAPAIPSVTPTSSTIGLLQSVNYTIANAESGILYSIKDNSVNTYYAPSKFGSGSSLSFTTNTFNSLGTYNLQVKATSLSGPGCESQSAATVSVSLSLPLTLISFDVQPHDGYTQLNWKSSEEINVSHFEIQRSDDGNAFYSIGNISANNNAQVNAYSFRDYKNITGTAWYRLLIIDNDGRKEMSRIVKLSTAVMSETITVSPNPFINKIDVQIAGGIQNKTEIILTDAAGRIIRKMKENLLRSGVMTISHLDGLTPGLYIIMIYRDGKIAQQTKLVKQR